MIQDSGSRTEFETGAVRDMSEGKGDMVSLPWRAILRLSRHYENGAKKYGRFNYQKGIPVSSFIDSACRHLAKYQCGCDDEDHLAAAAFNVLGAMLMEAEHPELVDLPARAGKNLFEYFERNTVQDKPETVMEAIKNAEAADDIVLMLNGNGCHFCPKGYTSKRDDCDIPCVLCICDWLMSDALQTLGQSGKGNTK